MTKECQGHGVTLRMMRKHAKLNQEQLALKIGSSNSSVSKLESGSQDSTVTQMEAWAAACGFELKVFVSLVSIGAAS